MENIFFKRLGDFMEELSITSDELGKIIGVSGSTVRGWREGRYIPYLANAVKFANYFNCTIDYLFGLEKDFRETKKRAQNYLFYERLRTVMKEKGVTRYGLTKKTSVKDSHLNNWRKGSDPRMDSVIAAVEHLNVAIDYLIWGNY